MKKPTKIRRLKSWLFISSKVAEPWFGEGEYSKKQSLQKRKRVAIMATFIANKSEASNIITLMPTACSIAKLPFTSGTIAGCSSFISCTKSNIGYFIMHT